MSDKYLKVSEYKSKYNPPVHINEIYRVVKELQYKLRLENGRYIKTYSEEDICRAVDEHEKGKRCKWRKKKTLQKTYTT